MSRCGQQGPIRAGGSDFRLVRKRQEQLGKAYSELWAWMGMAIIGSPLLASRLSARGSYVAALILALFQLVADQFYLKEIVAR